MELTLVDEGGMTVVEGMPGEVFMSSVEDIDRVIEACISGGAKAAVLYAANLPPAFFDLSSGQAGAILQKLRNYWIRLAVVCPAGSVQFRSRFGEMVADERRGQRFRLASARQAAAEWL